MESLSLHFAKMSPKDYTPSRQGFSLRNTLQHLLQIILTLSGIEKSEIIAFLKPLYDVDQTFLPHFLAKCRPIISDLIAESQKRSLLDWRYEEVAKCLYVHAIHLEVYRSNSWRSDFVSKRDLHSQNKHDFQLSLQGLKLMRQMYLKGRTDLAYETPQDVFYRVARFLGGDDSHAELFTLLREQKITFATSILLNANPVSAYADLNSCYILTPSGRRAIDFLSTLKTINAACDAGGGVSISLNNLLSKNEGGEMKLLSRKGETDMPLNAALKMIDEILTIPRNLESRSNCVCWVHDWNCGIQTLLNGRNFGGAEKEKLNRVQTGIIFHDLFFKRVRDNADWSFFLPVGEAKELGGTYGGKFEVLYERLEKEGKSVRTVKAREFFQNIAVDILQSGAPFIGFCENINEGSPFDEFIDCPNLCTEIMQPTTAAYNTYCTIATVNVSAMVGDEELEGPYEFDKVFSLVLDRVESATKELVRALNVAIDRANYLNESDEIHTKKFRDLGIGMCGLGSLLQKFGIAYEDGGNVGQNIARRMRMAALRQSCDEAKLRGAFYGFYRSMYSQEMVPGYLEDSLRWLRTEGHEKVLNDDFWLSMEGKALRHDIHTHGLANRQLLAMPPGSRSSVIANCSPGIEPIRTNLYSYDSISGHHTVKNLTLQKMMLRKGIWNDKSVDELLAEGGSIQNMVGLDSREKRVFKTAYEIPVDAYLNMFSSVQAFVDQGCSNNLYLSEASAPVLMKYIYNANEQKLKSLYYTRVGNQQRGSNLAIEKSKTCDRNVECSACAL